MKQFSQMVTSSVATLVSILDGTGKPDFNLSARITKEGGQATFSLRGDGLDNLFHPAVTSESGGRIELIRHLHNDGYLGFLFGYAADEGSLMFMLTDKGGPDSDWRGKTYSLSPVIHWVESLESPEAKTIESSYAAKYSPGQDLP